MTLQWLLNWWNLIFLLPFGLALLYLALYTVSGITFGDSDLDADGGFDTDADGDIHIAADAGPDLDHDLDTDHDMDTDHDADAEGDEISHGTPHMAAMNWLGVGRVPVSIVLMVLLLTWGTAGFITNAALQANGASAAIVSIPIAAVISIAITRIVVMLIVRYLPLYETNARRRHALLGFEGEAIFPIDHKFGMVSVRDDTGDLYQVPCRVDENTEPIAKGSKVQLVAYNSKLGLFYVSRKEAPSTTAA
jgi:membrane protein implicated in regulation of membrane protease activity